MLSTRHIFRIKDTDSSKKERIEVILIRQSGLGENEYYWRGRGALPSAKGRLHPKEPTPPSAHAPQCTHSFSFQGAETGRERETPAGGAGALNAPLSATEMIRREKSPRTRKKWSHHQTPQPHWHSKSTIFNQTSVYILFKCTCISPI